MLAVLIWTLAVFGPVLAWLLFRSSGYKRQPDPRPTGPGWELTDKRFLDPASGEVLIVEYCARTGGRACVRAV